MGVYNKEQHQVHVPLAYHPKQAEIPDVSSLLARAVKNYQGGHSCWFWPAPLSEHELAELNRARKAAGIPITEMASAQQ